MSRSVGYRHAAGGDEDAVGNLIAGVQLLEHGVHAADVADQLLIGIRIDCFGDQQRRMFAGAVSDHRVGLDSELAGEAAQRLIRREDSLGAGIHPVNPAVGVPLARLRRRKDDLARQIAARMIGEGAIDEVEHLADFGKVHAQIGEHVSVLRSLARKHQRELA